MADFLRGLLRQPDRQTIAGLLQQPTPNPLAAAVQSPQYIGGALRDPQFYADIGSRLADLLRGGVQDVLPTGTRTQKQADRLGMMVDPNYMQKMTDVGLAGMTVFHGSPYKFDKFDMSKIGTGEGAQAYGHGLYFAENPEVSKTYQRMHGGDTYLEGQLAHKNGTNSLSLKLTNPDVIKTDGQSLAVDAMSRFGNAKEAAMYVEGRTGAFGGPSPEIKQEALNLINGGKLEYKTGGSLYRVDLPDEHITKMLDYDKPLSQQSHVADSWGKENSAWMGLFEDGKSTGKDLLQMVKNRFDGNEAAATQYLRAQGIPGIRYLDGGSRTGGAGTSNFVVFDDQLPKIIGRE